MQVENQILEGLSTGVITLDAQFRVRYLNSAAQALLEVSRTRSEGAPIEQILLRSDPLIEVLSEARHSGSPCTRRALQLILDSGQEITLDVSASPGLEGAGPAMVVEIQPVDRLLKISRDEGMISAHEATRTVIRGLAHEIKNPLGGVRGAAQLLARELKDEGLQEYTGIIIEEADRLRDLVDRMLGPKTHLELAPVNVHEVTEHVRSLILAEAGEELQIRRDYDPSLPDLNGDRAQLIQATLNIVRNAWQATQGQANSSITLRTRAQRQFTIGHKRHRLVCRMDVEDNGPGISQALQSTIFVPMITGRAEGTGLGLSISQAIVNRHQGMLDFTSEPGKTVFSMYLPMEVTNA